MNTSTKARIIAILLLGGVSGCQSAAQPRSQTPAAEPGTAPAASTDPDSSEGWLSSRLTEVKGTPTQPPPAAVKPEPMVVELVATYPHDPDAFTQGLVMKDGVLLESTGLSGSSSVRRLDLTTGKVLQRTDLPQSMFAEGLTVLGDKIYQLTLSEQVALVYDRASLTKIREIPYQGESWGLCFDGTHVITSNGTDTLLFRDPETFEEKGRLRVKTEGRTFWVGGLNEIECVGDSIYGNVWPTHLIAKIDRRTGDVTAVIDASALPTVQARDYGVRVMNGIVMNGIAYRPETDTFLLTGKMWPHIYEVKLVPAPGDR